MVYIAKRQIDIPIVIAEWLIYYLLKKITSEESYH